MTRWSAYYAAGIVMGMTPRQVDECTFWEFDCCYEGHRKANQTEEQAPPPMSDAAAADLGIVGF
ncbi:hypothetical protein [Ensifer sp. ENS08]|uniref:hypothetical protein n=1 Tax=Ensifer sp. ENS08 TaxID=2769273 RepID=UPI00177BCBA4|nr:hypothetical protein [Ensifer sp. ENS08]MBD9569032.1 hypothetical protein [Ensifer sp. ENS08]